MPFPLRVLTAAVCAILPIALGAAETATKVPAKPAAKKVFISPFRSSVPEISIPNTHLVAKQKGVVYRGMAPLTVKQAEEMIRAGVTEVLIFRNDVAGETGIAEEKALFEKAKVKGVRIRAVHEEPFPWKDMTEFREPCRQTIRALKVIRSTLAQEGSGLFFHCTVGEDRTGYLSGLYRIVLEGQKPEKAFREEMCAHGYAEGDPNKPAHVSEAVHANVTKLFVKMLRLAEEGKLTREKLDESVCDADPADSDPALAKRILGAREEFRCAPQKL